MKERFLIKGKWPITKAQIFCVAGGILLYVVLEFSSVSDRQNVFTGGGLKRAGPGQGESLYEIEVEGLNEENANKKMVVEVPVRERHYTEKEADSLFNGLETELKAEMLLENTSLDNIRSNLNLITRLDAYGLMIRWETSDYDLVNSLGTVNNEDLPDSGTEIQITAVVSDGVYQHEYLFHGMVFPPSFSTEEKRKEAFRKWVNQIDEKQQTTDALILPEKFGNQTLTYFLPRENSYRILPLLGVILAVLLHVKTEVEKQKKAKQKEQQLLLDYSEVVSKLVVYVGAGFTVRGAWERIALGYEDLLKKGKRSIRPAYEEMIITTTQLKSGFSEGRAYSEFGRRCGLQPYIKLAALLEQSQKNGSKQLRNALELEMVSAFEQRKNAARKMGEEAGTKLLIPLLLMLAVVMVMIVVPAFLAFY